jgi:hypothetical protein
VTIAAPNWPQATLYIALTATVGLVVSVLIWSIFRTGQTAIRSDGRKENRTPVELDGWDSVHGAQRSQSVATGESDGVKTGSNRRKPLPWVATGLPRAVHGEGGNPLRKEGVAPFAPQEAPNPANPKAHRTSPGDSDRRAFPRQAGRRREQPPHLRCCRVLASKCSSRHGCSSGALDAALVGVPALDAVRDGGSFVAVSAGAAPTPLRGTRVHNVWIRTDAPQLAELAALVDADRLTLRVASTHPLETVAAAHERLAAGALRGRIVLEPTD